MPTVEEVYAHIQNTADISWKRSQTAVDSLVSRSPPTTLDRFFDGFFSTEALSLLSNPDSETINALHDGDPFPLMSDVLHGDVLFVQVGYLPEQRALPPAASHADYREMLSNPNLHSRGYGQRGELKLRLDSGPARPSWIDYWNDLAPLFQQEAVDSETLVITGAVDEELQRQIYTVLQSQFTSASALAKIPDFSADVLTISAISMLRRFVEEQGQVTLFNAVLQAASHCAEDGGVFKDHSGDPVLIH